MHKDEAGLCTFSNAPFDPKPFEQLLYAEIHTPIT